MAKMKSVDSVKKEKRTKNSKTNTVTKAVKTGNKHQIQKETISKKSRTIAAKKRMESVTIKAKDFISICFGGEDADILKAELDQALEKYDKVTVDFSELGHFTTCFFDLVFTGRLEQMPVEEYDARIFVTNLSEIGKGAYRMAYEGAVEYISLTPKQQEERDQIWEKVFEEMGWI
ncbi:hypothetical protein MsAg5_13740 [Methanosarcinaceae archaeon Ag5]|uniref:DUF4325 domain-containing protein n=1 Tax=Methanolapillus africanus TaxID=3028297 RepID=A0AAE4SFM8_9EURY|nr:hypothetical protein [Methanosarcinaceae archaeon Ag5]